MYSNEVDIQKTPLQKSVARQPVDILTDQGDGWVPAMPTHTLICARLVSRDPKYPLNASLLVHRVKIALSLRERLFHKPYYRLLYGERRVPGLVADRFGDVVVIQITTAGMERFGERCGCRRRKSDQTGVCDPAQ